MRKLLNRSQAKTTKVILASLLAASLSFPMANGIVHASEPGQTEVAPQSVLSDGIYDLSFKTLKINEDVPSGMDNRFSKVAKLIVKDGKMTVEMTVNHQNEMIEKLQVKKDEQWIDMDLIEGSNETKTRVVSFPIENLQDMVVVHVHVNLFGAIVEQDFRIQLIAPEQCITEKVGVTAFTSGTPKISDLQKYLNSQAEITKSATSTTVAVTFSNQVKIRSFAADEQKVNISSNEETTTYTFEIADLKKLVNATVITEGPVATTHNIQFRFDVKGAVMVVENPFKDISLDENKQAILNLYARNIIEEAENFNPRNYLTRGQFALLIARTLDLSTTTDAGFKDVQQLTDQERKNAINAVAQAGIIKKGENFHPNKTLTRQQSALMMFRTISYANQKELDFGSSLIYADEQQITDPEARKAFALLYAGEMLTGSKGTDGKVYIQPNKEVQRTHMAKVLNGALKYLVNK